MRKTVFAFCGIFLLNPAARAEPLPIDRVPEPLKPWVRWVLDGHEDAGCPALSAGQRECSWPARLELSVEDRSGGFRQSWQVFHETWAALPGDPKRWPQNVKVDGRPVPVILKDGGPRVRLEAGAHAVAGAFHWDSAPELIQIPRETGLVGLTIRGRTVPYPNRDEEGRLWLAQSAGRTQGEDRIQVVVHRRLIDEIPLTLITDIEIKVSGKNRELVLGRALPDRFIATALTGPLPARLEKDGRLRVQARPGDWRLELSSRRDGPAKEIKLPPWAPESGPWDKQEVWVFDARPDLRLVSIEGAPTVDPQQTELREDWRRLPAYLLKPGGALRLVERTRGDANPAPDQLTLRRTLWLDFDGGGYSVRDSISGALRRSWRMDMAGPTKLGRAAVEGVDQFITRSGKSEPGEERLGIELRQGTVHLDSDSRLDGARYRIPAVGWDHDFHQVSAELNLPPGWRLIHAVGVDEASPTWVSRWTLLDLFMVIILALAAAKLWGRRWGWLGAAALALSYHEAGAPRWAWVFLLAAEALSRVAREGRLLRAAESSRLVFRVILFIIAAPFVVNQVRAGLHPQLESRTQASWDLPSLFPSFALGELASTNIGALDKNWGIKDGAPNAAREGFAPAMALISSAEYSERKARPAPGQDMNVYAPDLKAQVSTGPGLPTWDWKSVSLSWKGPVERSQRMWLILIGPFANFLLALVRSTLLVLLALRTLGVAVGERLRGAAQSLKLVRPGLPYIVLTVLLLSGSASAETPSSELLRELQTRLLRPADCEPQCASITRLRLETSPGSLAARLEVSAAAPASIPLPGGAKQWSPASVALDGSPARGLMRTPDGLLHIPLAPGTHQIILEGPLPDLEIVDIPLPLKPHRVEAAAAGWTVDGLREDGLAEDNIQLTRARGARAAAAELVQSGPLPPFVRVERQLGLGLSWQVQTKVVRLTPAGTPIVVEVPLLPGESVTSPEIRTADGKAKISLGPQASEASWTSVLSQAKSLRLSAPALVPWTEVWRLEVSPIWHIDAQGIPVIHSETAGGARVREWRPWPGEGVVLSISRPDGVPGQTMTIDRSQLTVNPGLRASDFSLDFTYRASRGAEHRLTLPETAELQSLSVDDESQPVRQEKRLVTVPVLPGSHRVALTWRQSGGIGLFYRVPEVDLGTPSVNARVSVTVPQNRWILLTRGPRLGPAVLFWSALAVMALLSFWLGALEVTPLKPRDWFLLSVGLTQIPFVLAAIVAGWLLAWAVRRRTVLASPWRFNLVQLALIGWTAVALCFLYNAVEQGLLGQPVMQISGNGSWANALHWYLDRANSTLPRPFILCVPLAFYRLSMLAWALWLASALLRWLSWAWSCFNEGGLWKALGWSKPGKPAVLAQKGGIG